MNLHGDLAGTVEVENDNGFGQIKEIIEIYKNEKIFLLLNQVIKSLDSLERMLVMQDISRTSRQKESALTQKPEKETTASWALGQILALWGLGEFLIVVYELYESKDKSKIAKQMVAFVVSALLIAACAFDPKNFIQEEKSKELTVESIKEKNRVNT